MLFVSLILIVSACSLNCAARQIADKPNSQVEADMMACKSKMRQLGTGTLLYLGDWDDYYPLSVGIEGGKYTKPTANFQLQINSRYSYPETKDDPYSIYWADTVLPYLVDVKLFWCPAVTSQPIKKPRSAEDEKPPRILSYVYNGMFNGYNSAKVQSPSTAIVFWEGLGKTFYTGLGTSNPNLDCTGLSISKPCVFDEKSVVGFSIPRETMFIHNQGAHFGYADSSTRWRKLGVVISGGFTDCKVDVFRKYDETGKVFGDSSAEWKSPNLPKGVPNYPLFRPNFDINDIK